MSANWNSERSFEAINQSDLDRILRLAQADIESFFARNPKYFDSYHGKEKLIVLAQGAAMHFIDGTTGVKDFDVWFFYPKNGGPLPYRRRGVLDFGASKFGSHPNDKGFAGRRIDVLMRSDQNFNQSSPRESITRYLNVGATSSAEVLSQKAVIGLWPEDVTGDVLWPLSKARDHDFRGS